MPPESASTHPRRNDGLTRISLLTVLALLVLAAVGIRYWLLPTDHVRAIKPAIAASTPMAPSGAGDVDALLARARRAIGRQHLLAPAGDNAVAWYLASLRQQPGNRVAVEALREIFPFAAASAERTIDQGEPAEAQRQIDLLARADPANYTLTLLRARLAAKLQPLPAAAASAPPSRSQSVPVRETPLPASNTPVAVTGPTVVPAVPVRSSHPAVPAAAVAIVHPPVLVRRIEPYYPQDARRTRRQGWVELQFTVAADGSVEHAGVTDADPKNLFDHAALSAVERWHFMPGTRNGRPVAMPMHERITFRL